MHAGFRVALAGVWLALLAGCAVTAEQCDPGNANASFSTKFGCNTQGVYAQRVEHKQQVLLDEQRTNQLFRQAYQAIEAERSSVAQSLQAQQQQAANLQRSVDALLAELKQKVRGNAQLENEIAGLEQQMRDLSQQESPSVLQKRHELQKLQGRLGELQSDLGLR